MIGRVIGHFQVREKLGSGSMGEVYLAWDSRLRRPVALKILPPATIANVLARKRLQREALALSRLNHPCVAVLYDFVEEADLDCLIMEFVTGDSLDRIVARGAMDEATLLGYAVQIADGLAAAHEAGVVHRDIKPSNLRITPQGKVKLLDFGLAQLLQATTISALSSGSSAGMIAGTMAYIAPEVWEGAPATAASDLYSVGVLMYEMATGARPFEGLTGQALVHATKGLQAPPARAKNPDLSPELDAVIARLLSKRPEDRFASARDLYQTLEDLHAARRSGRIAVAMGWAQLRRRALLAAAVTVAAVLAIAWGLAGNENHARRSVVVAVLPFTDPYGDSTSTYYADGVTHDLTVALAEYDSLQVISSTSMNPYRHDGRPPSEIAREIHADRMIDGSIQRRGDHLRLSVQVIDGATNRILKSRRYDSDADGILGLVDRMAGDLAGWMKAGSPAREREPAQLKVDPVAYDLYLRGRFHLDRRNADGIHQALSHFQRSIQRDSTFAPAWSGLADAWSALAYSGFEPPQTAFPQARRAVDRALALDPQLADGYVSLGNVLQNHDRDWEGAANAYRKALALNPNHPVAHHWYASNLALRGRFDEAIREIAPARMHDPNSLPVAVAPAAFLYFARRYDEALAALEVAIAMDSTSGLVQRTRAAILDRLGREDEAVRCMCRWLEGQQQEAVSRAVSGAYAARGFRGAVQVLIAALERKRSAGLYEPATHVAELYARLGEREPAFRWLTIAEQERDTELNRLKVDPIFDPLRGDARFTALLRAVGFEVASDSTGPAAPAAVPQRAL